MLGSMKRSLQKTLLVAGVGSSLVLAIILVASAVFQSSKLQTLAEQGLSRAAISEQSHITEGVMLMLKAQQELLEKKVQADLNVARHVLSSAGRVSFSRERVQWKAINQFTEEQQQVELPKMTVGGKWLGQNRNFENETPIVDEITDLVGGTCTIFQRMNEDGDMLRVATNVKKLDGTRAIGTYIPAVNPDGAPNPVLSTVLAGKTFNGRAYVVNKWYITSYEPIRSETGRIVGILYVGFPEESAESIRKGITNVVVGKTGYVYVLNSSGEYVISKGGQRDGEQILDAKDSEGKFFIREIIKRAKELAPEQIDTISYPWQNAGDPHPRLKTVSFAYFAPWDWVVSAGTWNDEFLESSNEIGKINFKSTISFLIISLIVLALVSGLWIIVARKIVNPITAAVAMLKDISTGEGDLTKRVHVDGENEIAVMACYFNDFIEKLQKLIADITQDSDTVADSAKQLSKISDKIASSAQRLSEQTVSVAAATEESSTNISSISSASEQMSVNTSSVASSIEEMNASLAEVAKSCQKEVEIAVKAAEHTRRSREVMDKLNHAAESIGKVVGVITDIADQTNLLALNATIEAASAGDAGKGFAVVAGEVKELARQTAQATQEIEKQVEDIQQNTTSARSAIGLVSDVVEEVNTISQTIVSAVEQQSATVSEISKNISEVTIGSQEVSRNVAESAQGLGEVSSTIQNVSSTVSETGAEIQSVQKSAGELAELAQRLKKMMGQFKV